MDSGIAFIVGTGATALILALGHWFPWPRELHRLEAYVYGVAAILIGSGVWLWASGYRDIWGGLTFMAVIAGLTTGLTYLVDEARSARKYRRIVNERLDKYNPDNDGSR
jgi:predicted membrane protein